jgi:hypothetical protein
LIWITWTCVVGVVIVAATLSYIQVIGMVLFISAFETFLIHFSANTVYNPMIDLCIPTKPLPSIMAAAPIASTSYELILTILTVTKTFRHVSIADRAHISPLVSP